MTKTLSETTILLIDFDPGHRRVLEIFLAEIGCDNLLAATDLQTGLELFIQSSPDLCLIAISQDDEGFSSLQLAKKIRVRNTWIPIIFLSAAYNEEEYRQVRLMRPSSFLSMELSSFKLRKAIDLALLNSGSAGNLNTRSVSSHLTKSFTLVGHHYFFRINDHYKRVPVQDIAYFFTKNRVTYARMHNQNLSMTVQLKTLTTELAHSFHRIHKRYLVNINHIDHIYPKGSIVEIAGESIPIGYVYRKAFLERINLLK